MPGVAFGATNRLRTDFPDPGAGKIEGAKPDMTPGGTPLMLRETALENGALMVDVTLSVEDPPCAMMTEVDDAERENGAATMYEPEPAPASPLALSLAETKIR